MKRKPHYSYLWGGNVSVVAEQMGSPIGTIIGEIPTSDDLDDYGLNGIYTVYNKPINAPEELPSNFAGTLFVYKGSRYSNQMLTSSDGASTYMRTLHPEGKSWHRIDNFGYNTLAELAAVLKPLMQ